jgi:uncharacterized protein YndB with AHSA1/START domain
MVDILHKVGIAASPADTYKALTTLEGLAGWWTRDTTGDCRTGGVIRFRFSGGNGFDMKVLDQQPMSRVLWQVVDGPGEWIGTTISWDLKQEDDYTVILFKHAGWREPVDFMHHCSTKWGVFLISLKALLEGAKATPWPNDVKIDKWELAA